MTETSNIPADTKSVSPVLVVEDDREQRETLCAMDEVNLSRYATDLGLDLRRVRREMREHAHRGKIRAGRKAGVRLGIVRAPTFFIDCSQHKNAFGQATLIAAVQAAVGGS